MPLHHALILRRIRTIFAGLDKGEYEATLNAMASQFEHRFGGANGPLGGPD